MTEDARKGGSQELRKLLADPSYGMGLAIRSAATETLAEVEKLRSTLRAIADWSDPSREQYLSEFECRQWAKEALDGR